MHARTFPWHGSERTDERHGDTHTTTRAGYLLLVPGGRAEQGMHEGRARVDQALGSHSVHASRNAGPIEGVREPLATLTEHGKQAPD